MNVWDAAELNSPNSQSCRIGVEELFVAQFDTALRWFFFRDSRREMSNSIVSRIVAVLAEPAVPPS
jgi:hypothetical protein